MPQASYLQSGFLGGEISKAAQGRYDLPAYKTEMAVSLNGYPVEIGAWTRRPGTAYAGHTRGGGPGRVIKFDFEQAIPYTLEFTAGFLRFRSGTSIIATNDAQVVIAISAANPAVVQTTTAHGWATGNTVLFPAVNMPLLQNRQFTITVVDTTHFSLQDALTGANIDGSTLGSFLSGTIARVQELATPYASGLWSSLRAIQAETTDILLNSAIPPQALTVTTLPSTGVNAVFGLKQAVFNDGPYLDPFTNGVQVTPSGVSGVITLTLGFAAYSATTSYAVGAFVTSSGVNYRSLVDQNVNNTPASSPSQWAATSAGIAIAPNGFQGSDIGRLVRLFNEPPAWAVGATYTANQVVSYNPSGLPGASTYWSALTSSNIGNVPGTDLKNWSLMPSGAAIWTWGKIVSLSNIISPTLAGSANFGNMTFNGGVAAAFDGVFSKPFSASAAQFQTGGAISSTTDITLDSMIGKDYSAAGAQQVSSVTVYPSTDVGYFFGTFNTPTQNNIHFTPSITLVLRASQTLPASPTAGTILGSVGPIANTLAPVSIPSSDQVTAWKYVWVEVFMSTSIAQTQAGIPAADDYQVFNIVGQLSVFSPTGTGISSGINVEILGPALLYTTTINTWRLGVYSYTTGWPTCGTYHEGRLWLGGAVANRFDACVANGIVGATVNFAPTDQYGAVSAANGISYVLNSDGVNPMFWMKPDLQGVIMGTQEGEWLIFSPGSGSIAPNNIAAHRVTKIGCAFVEPARTEHTNVIVQRYSIKLMEYFADVFSGKFSAPNLADKAAHITRTGIAELAYTSAATPVIWGRCNDGSLFGVTYKRDTLMTSQGPTFYGWHRHMLGSGRTVESVCSGPSVGGNLDALTMVTVDASGVRHVEVLTDTQDEDTPTTALWLLDDAVTPTSYSVNNSTPAPYGGLTINGLWHLNGQTVQVFAGGLDCGLGEGGVISDFVVANGSVTVPFGDGVSAGSGEGLFTAAFVASFSPTIPIVVGFTFNSDAQLLRPNAPADTGARNGPGFGKIGRAHWYALQCVNTSGLSIGTDFSRLDPVIFRDDSSDSYLINQPFNGMQTDVLEDTYSFDTQICWRISRPWPAMIVAAGGFIEKMDK